VVDLMTEREIRIHLPLEELEILLEETNTWLHKTVFAGDSDSGALLQNQPLLSFTMCIIVYHRNKLLSELLINVHLCVSGVNTNE
jgi:hypothetical protein